MQFNHLILCHRFLLLPSIFPSIRVFSNESALHIMWPKYWSFSISTSSEYSGLIFFRIDWFDLLAVQGTLKSLLQHHSSKASILQCSAFFTVQLQFISCSVESDSLWQPHGLQHARPPCPSPTPRACSNSCPLSWWCHPTSSPSVVPSSCLQSFPASGSFLTSQFFASDGQSTGASASASVLPMNIQDWFPLGWTDLISLQSKGLSKVFSSTTIQNHHFFSAQPSLWSNHSWLLEKHRFDYTDLYTNKIYM